jgi:hypothetical protein
MAGLSFLVRADRLAVLTALLATLLAATLLAALTGLRVLLLLLAGLLLRLSALLLLAALLVLLLIGILILLRHYYLSWDGAMHREFLPRDELTSERFLRSHSFLLSPPKEL